LNTSAIIADVGFGAGPPSACAAIAATVICVALTVARLLPQSLPAARSAAPTAEMLSELAGRITAAIAPALQVSVDAADIALEAGLIAQLSARGVRVVDAAASVAAVRVSCLDNLRDLVCTADIAGTTRNSVLVARARESLVSPPTVRVALELRPILSLDRRILDVVRTDDEMLVLTADAVLRYERERESWRVAESRPLVNMRPRPRDVRGRLRVSAPRLEVFLSGVTCAGTSRPLAVTCTEGNVPWPLDIGGASLDPLRNYFTTPDGVAFYGVARAAGDPTPRWIAATLDRRLTFLDENRQAVPTSVGADDVASIGVPCFPAGVIVASTLDGDGTLTPFEVVGRTLVPVTAPLALTGDVTALWSLGAAALVVTHHPDGGRYVAHELSLTCSR
jgi:hypothetical protein